jgi:hypothetical protein
MLSSSLELDLVVVCQIIVIFIKIHFDMQYNISNFFVVNENANHFSSIYLTPIYYVSWFMFAFALMFVDFYLCLLVHSYKL